MFRLLIVFIYITLGISGNSEIYCPSKKKLNEKILNKVKKQLLFGYITIKHKGYIFKYINYKDQIKLEAFPNRTDYNKVYTAYYDLNGNLKSAGVMKNNQIVGKWCYITQNGKILYKDYDKDYKFSYKQVKRMLRKMKIKPYRITKYNDLYRNIWVIEKYGYNLYIDGDNGEILDAVYLINLYDNGKCKEFNYKDFPKYDKCILKNLKEGKTESEMKRNCNIDVACVVTGYSREKSRWGYIEP